MTPTAFEKSQMLQDPATSNGRLELYHAAIKAISKKRNLDFADLFGLHVGFATLSPDFPPLTENGIHLSEAGYRKATSLFERALNIKGFSTKENTLQNTDSLRKAIIEKNKLYFYRWRPQNETYLFGFRKHEQGKNAKEIAEFDPLIAKAEEEIDRLKKVKTPREQIVPVEKKK
jgi:hypothetical protein